MGALEFVDEGGKQSGALGILRERVVVHEIAAAAREDLADGGRHEVGGLGVNLARAKEVEDFVGVAE